MSTKFISADNVNYKTGRHVQAQLDPDPIKQFSVWLDEAMQTDMPEPTAMNLATCNNEGALSSRMVLLKEVDERGFVFYTNYESRKAADIKAFTQVALCFWWGPLNRQVRIEGSVELVSEQESDEYFASRPRGSQIGAIASKQSSQLDSYQQLRDQVTQVEQQFAEAEQIPRPNYWGGYRVIPQLIEFWLGRPDRLHDRLRYMRTADGTWKIERLSP